MNGCEIRTSPPLAAVRCQSKITPSEIRYPGYPGTTLSLVLMLDRVMAFLMRLHIKYRVVLQ